MPENFLRYLERERDRLDALISRKRRSPPLDEGEIGRLTKARTMVEHQLAHWRAEAWESNAA